MKKPFQLALIAIFSMISFIGSAQNYIDYKWEQYNIIFSLADDFKVNTNTAEEFTATGDGMEFAIFPFNDETVDHSNITQYTIEIAKSLELEELHDVDVVEINDLEGAYVEGAKEGMRAVLLGFIDPESESNFFAIITFANDDQNAVDEAVTMIKSFRKK